MLEKNMLKCPECSKVLKFSLGYTGCDWNCEAGEGSKYGYEVALQCDGCGSIYTIGHIKSINDLSLPIEKHRPFKKS